MPWRGHSGSVCHGCERHVDECGPLSARYLCEECGVRRMTANLDAMRRHDGLYFDHWLRRMRAAFGVVEVEPDRREA